METIFQFIAVLAILAGTFFSAVGVIGYYRFPDVYSRMNTTGKVGLFGSVLLLIAAALLTPLGWGKATALILFLMLMNPVTTHALASAAYRLGIPMHKPIRDDLAQAADIPPENGD
jgi:multicomponent Na+:H+ antiporter subunit G